MTKVYLAGKIAPHDWRQSIAAENQVDDVIGDWVPPLPVPTKFEGVQYVGPFFVGCDHGCSHGNDTHGQGGGCLDFGHRDRTAQQCLDQIRAADLVYAWLDDLQPSPQSTAYGTLVEVGYALALEKPVVVAAARAPHDPSASGVVVDRYPIDDLWFAWSVATGRVQAKTPERGLEYVIEHLSHYVDFRPLGL